MDKPVLDLAGVHAHYGEFHALRGVDLTLWRGEVIALIGPSGSGKSTLLRTANLLVTPTHGRISFEGREIVRENGAGRSEVLLRDHQLNEYRTRVGIVFQHFNLFPHLSVMENLVLAPTLVLGLDRDTATARAMELLKTVGLAEKADAMPGDLSGGQKQRVAIARSLAMEPEVMLLDEITSALDPETVGEVIRTMKLIAERHVAMLVATHEMDFAREVADRIVFMDEGRIVESGPPAQILAEPQEPRTRLFLDRILRRATT